MERVYTLKLLVSALAALFALVIAVASASAGTPPLSKAQYIAKLQAAEASTSKAENAAMKTLQSKTSTAAQVKKRFFAMGKAQVDVGRAFATIVPPTAAVKANHDFARAEALLGHQNEAIAQKLPTTKPAIVKYLQSLKSPSGGRMLDRAIAELHTAGFKA